MAKDNKVVQTFGCFESEMLHLQEEIETFHAEIDATIGQLRETLHALRNPKRADSLIARFKSERTGAGRKRT